MKTHNLDKDELQLSIIKHPKDVINNHELSADSISSKQGTNQISLIQSIHATPLISESSSMAIIEHNSQGQESHAQQGNLNKKLLLTSSLCGLGVGVAMMPIFNEEVWNLDNYGIHIHEYEAAFIVSTINTLIVTSICSTIHLFRYFDHLLNNNHEAEDLTNLQKTALNLSKVGAVAGSILPIALLWNIELHDQKVSESSGFDEFIAWATFATIPLLIFKFVEAYEAMSGIIKGEYDNIDLDGIGSKLVTYGITVLSALARGISFSAATEELAKNIGFDEDTSRILGILIGGILGSAVSSVSEYYTMKSLFQKREQPLSAKEIIIGGFSSMEGIWFSLPIVSTGLSATQNWDPFIRAAIFAPFFVSRTVFEATNMYNALKPKQGHSVNQIV